ncbi:hypothetical protein KXD93_14920 [Mucilaginibacter sp. BJC16-A38]|uniref:hypothetical protein n=1 Tax=Mucilaginibacter phenanthrenivorans TaxID=1234842 RepID=UPI002157E9AA|nr:hypothetical protein [Mucilaginibacter phenanthrenivorans]MCR8558947.1 hypothetical protein [Mucilaginibacter phenanthrenivorans]
MKKYFSIVVFILLSAKLFAQYPPDLVQAMRGGRFSLEADKSILSAGEVAQLNVNVFIPPAVDSHTGEATTDGRDVHASDAARTLANAGMTFVYHAQNWKIIQGGGSIDITDEFNIRYTAPSQAPRDNTIVISVDLIPTGHDMPKVVLLKTLYFEDGDNIFAFNVPASGINDARYSQKTTGARASATNPSTVAAVDPAILARIPAADRARLLAKKSQVDAALQSSDVNLVSLTSNANAIFDPANNVTVIKFIGLGRDMGPGSHTSAGNGIMMITYTGGLTKGVHPFNGKSNAIYFTPDIRPSVKICACSMQGNQSLQKLHCGGTLTITSMDGDFITGTISSTIWNNKTGQDKTFNRGTVYGVFKIRKAYQDYHR